jgi:hypothetical protein
MGQKVPCRVWIVMPTLELARQLQRVIQNLVGDENINDDLLHVLGADDDDLDEESSPLPLLSSLKNHD